MRIETPHARRHLVACLAAFGWAAVAGAQPSSSTERARDRGPGLPTSMFATYIERGELIVYPFFEHYRDRNLEYRPAEFGYRGEGEYRGRYRANEALLFLGYGLTDNVALEFEASTIRAALDRDPQDVSDMPPRIVESGIGDIEGQLRWRWKSETSTRPELFSYAELVVPHHGRKHLIGTPGTQVKAGTGVVRGFRWGTVTARAALEYDRGSTSRFDVGEYAVEYVRRLSPAWRVYVGFEGQPGEGSIVTDVQWHFSRSAFLRVNNGFALTAMGTDWAPEVGVVLTRRRR